MKESYRKRVGAAMPAGVPGDESPAVELAQLPPLYPAADRVTDPSEAIEQLDLPKIDSHQGRDVIHCRVCGSSNIAFIGCVEYLRSYQSYIYVCRHCRCRFTTHDDKAAELLHASEHSRYGGYRDAMQSAKTYYDRGDPLGLREELSAITKYKYVIDTIESEQTAHSILEFGCARGALASFFIMSGYSILGIDIAPSAVASATLAFGPHFFLPSAEIIKKRAPYDIIYHTGMIGCVADPLGLTRSLLSLLRPEGKLIFNAPNAGACVFRRQLWLDDAPPPDVVTLFKPGFWTQFFSQEAFVQEQEETISQEMAVRIALKRLLRPWRAPTPIQLADNQTSHGGEAEYNAVPTKRYLTTARRLALYGILKLWPRSFAPKLATEFGIFVTMTKK